MLTKPRRITDADLPPDWRAQRQQERRDSRQAATVFARICAEGDADKLHLAAQWLNETLDGWTLAMAKITRLSGISREIQDAFLPIWVEHKHLPLRVGNRPLMARALRLLMPRNYTGPALTLYRGTESRERKQRLYSFSWTTDIVIARKFGQASDHPEINLRGIVLQTTAPAEAILLVRQPEEYYDEGEVVVDPYRLGRISVV